MTMQFSRERGWPCGPLLLAMLFALSPTGARADFPGPVVEYVSDDPELVVGQPITVLWTSGDPEGSVMIDLIDINLNQVVSNVTPAAPNLGRIDWTFPSNLSCEHTYLFYIQDKQPKWTYGQPFTVVCGNPSP